MKFSFIKVCFLLSGIILTAQTAQADTTYNGISLAAIIDVRTPAEFAAGHVRGAINIPLDRIDAGIQHVRGVAKDSPILLYCRSGVRSAKANKMLKDQGFSHVMDGGSLSNLAQTMPTCSEQSC